MTDAEKQLVELRRNYPPGELDFAQVVFAMNPAKTLVELAMRLHGAPLLCAEKGSTQPNAYTRCFGDGSHLVTLNTGLIDFVRAVNRTLFSNATFHPGTEAPIAPVLSAGSVAVRLAALYQAWPSDGLQKREEPLQADPIELSPPVGDDAEQFTRAALLFILSHELGHAVLHAERLRAGHALSQADELDADAFGIRLIMTGWGNAGRQPWRVATAGALIALRTLSALARLGHVFPGDHPPPDLRLTRLGEVLRELCVPEEAYYHATTIAIAFEEQMEAAELIIGSGGARTVPTCERIVSAFCAILEEICKGVMSREAMAAAVTGCVKGATDDVLTEAGRVAGRILSPRSPWFAERETWRTRVGLLQSLMPGLPAPLAAAYGAAQADSPSPERRSRCDSAATMP